MTLDDLRVFTAIVESESLGAVARDLGCTQPAVSQHLARLERELGVTLLNRSHKGVTLTFSGRILYQASSAGLGALTMAVHEIQRVRDGRAGRLSISTGGTTVRHYLREAVVRFRKQHPEVSLHFEPASSTLRCLEAVAQRRADMAFVTISENLPGFEQRPVLANPLLLLVRRDDPFAVRRQMSIKDLQTIRYISLPEFTASYGFIRDRLAREGLTLTPTVRVDDFDTANVFVELGLGHAIVPAVQSRDFVRGRRVKAIPIQGLPPVRVGWAARNFRVLPPVALDFMEILLATVHHWKDVPGLQVIHRQ